MDFGRKGIMIILTNNFDPLLGVLKLPHYWVELSQEYSHTKT
jgi:hypothetical protein